MRKKAGFLKSGRRILAAVLTGGILFAGLPWMAYAAEPELTITSAIDSESRAVTVKVSVVPAPAETVRMAMFVLNPGENANVSLQDITDDTLPDIVCISRQGALDENGECTFSATLPAQAIGGRYQVKISDLGLGLDEKLRSSSFYYASNDEIEEAKAAMNTASAATLEERLHQYAEVKPVLGLNLSGDYAAAPKAEVHTMFLQLRDASGSFSTVSEIQTAFQAAVGFAMLNAADAAQMDAVIRNYRTVLQLEENDDYTGSADIRAQTHRVLVSLRSTETGSKFASLSSLQEAYRTAIAIGTLNCSGRAEITQVLEKYNAVFGLKLDGDYAGLGSEQIEVNKALFQKAFTNVAEIRHTFEEKLKEVLDGQKKGTVSKPSGRPGGGGSGGSGSIRTDVTVTPNQPVTLPEQPSVPSTEERTPSGYFSDIAHVGWAVESIEALAERQIIDGTGHGLFEPDAKVTREQFLKMLMTGLGLLDERVQTDFTDVELGQWYYPYIASAQKLSIVSGVGEGAFGLNREITRQEMAVFIDRALKSSGVVLPDGQAPVFSDEAEIDGYAVQSVRAMQCAGIINGVGDNRFAPKESATRAEAAKMIYGLLRLTEQSNS